MIVIEYGPIKSKVTSTSSKELGEALRLLRKDLVVKVEGYFFSPLYQKGLWDGTKSFITPSGVFLSGLTSKVIKILKADDFEVDIQGYPAMHPACEAFDEVSLAEFNLRAYQVASLHSALRFSRGIIEIATNGGKTAFAAGFTKVLGVPPTLFVVPRQVLIAQAADDFRRYLGVQVGVVQAGKFAPNVHGVTIAIFHTLVKHLKKPEVKRWLSSVEVLFLDEVHFVTNKAFQKVAEAVPARFRLGLSGTPFRQIPAERLLTVGTTGPVLSKVSNQELMDQNVSVRPSVCLVTPNLPPNLADSIRMLDYADAIQRNPRRNALIAQIAQALVLSGRQTVVMVHTVRHARILAKRYPGAVISHANAANKKEVLARLKRGDVFCLICTAIFDTGLSVDHIEGLIMASGGKSKRIALQRIGRAVRKSKTKEKSLWVFDFMDDFHRVCRKHSRERRKIYENEKAFVITESLCDCPEEVQNAVPRNFVSSKNWEKSLGISHP